MPTPAMQRNGSRISTEPGLPGADIPSSHSTEALELIKPLLLSMSEAAAVLGVGRTTIYDLVRQGALQSVKIGRRSLVPLEDLNDYVRHLKASSPRH